MNIFQPKTVESITASFTKMATQLRTLSAERRSVAQDMDIQAQRLIETADVLIGEAEKAERVAAKIDTLLNDDPTDDAI